MDILWKIMQYHDSRYLNYIITRPQEVFWLSNWSLESSIHGKVRSSDLVAENFVMKFCHYQLIATSLIIVYGMCCISR